MFGSLLINVVNKTENNSNQWLTLLVLCTAQIDASGDNSTVWWQVRNIGYAVSIAIMSVTMLMVMTSDYKQQVAETTSFTQESKQTIEQLSAVPFLSDKEFTAYINEKNITETQEVSTAVSINSQVRLNAARAGLYAVAIFMLMFLFSLKNLPSRSLMIKKDHEVDEVFEQFEH
ncbi:TPA: hypothetical protein ACX6R6_001857 [Photobacterium damselae]